MPFLDVAVTIFIMSSSYFAMGALVTQIPRFIEGLQITDTDLGVNSPIIRRASPPKVDNRGIWVYLDISYGGSCCITLTTKFNPWKLGKNGPLEREMEEISPDSKHQQVMR